MKTKFPNKLKLTSEELGLEEINEIMVEVVREHLQDIYGEVEGFNYEIVVNVTDIAWAGEEER